MISFKKTPPIAGVLLILGIMSGNPGGVKGLVLEG
jgi:hypothetical protein